MQSIKIAFYLGERKRNPKASVLDRLICFFTDAPYSHVELVHQFDEYSRIGHCWGASAPDKGVRPKAINLDPSRWEVYHIKDYKDLPEINEWFKPHQGKSYDWIGALGVKLCFLRHHPNKLFCSEVAAMYLDAAGKPERYSPIQLFKVLSPHLVLIDPIA